jgi:hypothetical protein
MAQPQTIFQKLRSLETEGGSLHELIVNCCEVGDRLVEAGERVFMDLEIRGVRQSPTLSSLRRALAAAYRINGNNGNGAKAA